jgi:hypothetical protein
VPVAERIAVFDNDGTLWCEQPMPAQLYFAVNRVKALVPLHPEWSTKAPFASLLKGDVNAALAGGDHAILNLMMTSVFQYTLSAAVSSRYFRTLVSRMAFGTACSKGLVAPTWCE